MSGGPSPLDVQPVYGRKEIWRSLHTSSRREAEAKSHAVLADLEQEIEAKRRELRAADEERAFPASPRFDAALREHGALANRMMTGIPRRRPKLRSSANRSRRAPSNSVQHRAEAIAAIDCDLAELEGERARASLVTAVDEDGEPVFGSIALYTGARIAEVCQLTKSDLQVILGTSFLHIREDAKGKSVKTRGSIRKVSLHQQLVTDGLLEWIEGRKTEPLFSGTSAAASKRLNRRMRSAGLGKDKPFHSFRHTFKGTARRHMDMEWHDRLTGRDSKPVGQRYGDCDLRTLKEKIDLITFGIETAPQSPPAAPRRHSLRSASGEAKRRS